MPKISVILTSYNHDQFIHEAIDSVLQQTFQDFELLIWDDASSDQSWSLINQYTDLRIKAFRNDVNKGPVLGVNKIISEIAVGEYIAIHHSDDAWELNKLEKQLAFLEEHQDIGAVFTWAKIIDEQGGEQESNYFSQENKSRWEWLHQLFMGENRLNHPSILIRKQSYQEVGLYRYSLAQTPDAEMWSRVLLKFPIHVIPEKLTKHRLFTDNSNTSGVRVDVKIRISNEWNVLRKNFLALTDFDDIVAIFPSLKRYRNSAGYDNKFLLAMACLHECKQRNAWQLGLTWLFELLNDDCQREKIATFYNFSYADLIKLTAEFDVYGIESVSFAELQAEVEHLRTSNAWLESQCTLWKNAVAEHEQAVRDIKQAINDIQAGNDWLESQCTLWKNAVAEHEQAVRDIKQAINDIQAGNDWLESQCTVWKNTVAEREGIIATLQTYIQDLRTANDWSEAQRIAWHNETMERDKVIATLQEHIAILQSQI